MGRKGVKTMKVVGEERGEKSITVAHLCTFFCSNHCVFGLTSNMLNVSLNVTVNILTRTSIIFVSRDNKDSLDFFMSLNINYPISFYYHY
jgi:hypothetical protein